MQKQAARKTRFRIATVLLLMAATGALLQNGYLAVNDRATTNNLPSSYGPQIPSEERIDITYESFGAVGNGIDDDVAAIRAAHDYANALYEKDGICTTVYGTEGSTYYIGNVDPAIEIKTNTNWRNCTFIVDDYIDADGDGNNDVNCNNDIFVIRSQYNSLDLGAPKIHGATEPLTINRADTKLDHLVAYIHRATAAGIERNGGRRLDDRFLQTVIKPGLLNGDEMLVYVENDTARQYIRRGANENKGSIQQDLFLIDREGNVLREIVWDFDAVTSLVVYPVDKTPLTVKNGTFISYTNNQATDEYGQESGYTLRGIQICRANVTMDSVHHLLDERMHEVEPRFSQTNGQGNKSSGFIRTNLGAAYFVCNNSVITPHQPINKTTGTYDLSLNYVVDARLSSVSYPHSDGDDQKYYELYMANINGRWERWGVMTSNYAKDVVIENCQLNRIDSHRGVWNLTVSDTVIGQYGFTLAGGGRMIAENITVDGSKYLVNLRGDYGSTWRGSMEIKNVTMIAPPMDISLISYENDGTWDFGYDCYYPDLLLQDIIIDDALAGDDICLIPILQDNIETRNYPYHFSDSISMINIRRKSKKKFDIFPSNKQLDMDMYRSGKKTLVYLADINLAEDDIDMYNTTSSQFTVLYR